MIYELRVYRCLPNRLPALLKRFETQTLRIWEKHGIRQAGFWTTMIGESNQDLTYLLAWESLAEREKKWNAFGADPDWLSARAKTEANGAIVARVSNEMLQPTPFSSVQSATTSSTTSPPTSAPKPASCSCGMLWAALPTCVLPSLILRSITILLCVRK